MEFVEENGKNFFWMIKLCIALINDLYFHNQTSHRQVHQARTHRQHTATYQINNWMMQTSREVVTALSKKDSPLKMVKQL
jgi:hypothetical protein